MRYRGFYGNCEFSEEDQVYWGKIKLEKDLCTYESDTYDQIETEFHRAVDDYLLTCEELGKAIPALTFYLFVNSSKSLALSLEEKIKEYLVGKGQKLTSELEEADILLSLGGDGTFIRAANLIHDQGLNTPIFGINCGTLGYLTEGTKHTVWECLDQIIARKFMEEDRARIWGECIDGGEELRGTGLNEILLAKKDTGILTFDILVNGQYLMELRADGMICSTPTGATGYALSCGGSFLTPTSNLFQLTPLAPHTLLNRSFVLDESACVELMLNPGCEANMVVDGNCLGTIHGGYTLKIKLSKNTTKVISVERDSFIHRISQNFT